MQYGRSHADERKERRGRVVVKQENMATVSPAFERRQRRHKQAAREADTARRERDGKKPFYITLDQDGVPYGSGRPMWMAEIQKLAVGLDPSCTHIKKQTYEDVSLFKERLNQNYEYSGELNEDYLRGLMGKAVTRKRRDLILFIRDGGSQPNHIDSGVWERLLKLEKSKQWEEKSQQGRHANACRKTINRTGNRGVNGVRENLRETLGRSPDPDEVYTEAHRPKGSKKKKAKKETVSENWEDIAEERGTSEEDGVEQWECKSVHKGGSEEGVGNKSHLRDVPQGDQVFPRFLHHRYMSLIPSCHQL